MRDCVKNKQSIYVAHYLGKFEVLDSYGEGTGVYTRRYSVPKLRKENVISSHNVTNSISSDMFGTMGNYSALIRTSEYCDYAVGDIFWINKRVGYTDDGQVDYGSANYVFGGEYFSLNTKVVGLNTYNEKNKS